MKAAVVSMFFGKVSGMYKLRVITLGGAVLMAAPASAQGYFPNIMVSDFPDPVVGKDSGGDYSDSVSSSDYDRPKAEALPVDGRFTVSQSRRKANALQFVAAMKQQDPAVGQVLEQSILQGDLFATLDGAMRESGLSSSNVGDAFALWWLSSWQAAHGDFDLNPSKAQIFGVKNQAAAMISNWPGFAALTNDQKQDVADNFILSTLLVVSAVQGAKQNPEQSSAVQNYVRNSATAMGMDLTALKLTDNRFAAR